MRSDQMINNIVSAMMEIDQNNMKTNFGVRDILTLPKGIQEILIVMPC